MKNKIALMCALAVVMATVPAFAIVPPEGKNGCLLYGNNCPGAVECLAERINKLKTEIARGEKVYTPEELRLLDRNLQENDYAMRSLTKPGK
ncbi:hypothetical protein FO488_03705 [Geobacter sp. FeAm09]|uniref:hypothetical protein n=1 Tax=Geobacter sp. FeAm09 TaxID=2597769 RepID=UPI0011EBAEB3|nr:hypothetical protein [Geobacter sp. FeAm09]QEM67345.1 hypothetical protein FO488_03705 [Geobacter sp. FeAm09]